MKRSRLSLSMIIPVIILLIPCEMIGAGGAEEEAGSDRGAYVAGQGQIIPPEEINISSYVASVDYGYPDPSEDLGVTLYSGHRQVSLAGQEEIIQIGIQGRRTPFAALPVLNLAVVIDASGSMSEKDKIQWAKESFDLLLERLRPQDILSVVVFAEEATVLLEATLVSNIRNRSGLRDRIHAVLAQGGSQPETGLAAGYAQVQRNFRAEHVNRVLLISDGLGDPEEALELVRKYQLQGITLSTVSVGMNCNLMIMKKLSKGGTGSSRFISNREKMAEIFNSDLDRMVVPIAYDLALELEFTRSVELIDTWGYNHRVTGNRIRYSLPALHHRDYETILVQIRLLPGNRGRKEIVRLRLSYTDRAGKQRALEPLSLSVDYTDTSLNASGISDPTVLKGGTMLHTAQGLEAIGYLYFQNNNTGQEKVRLDQASWHAVDIPQEDRLETVVSAEQSESTGAIRANKQRCLDMAEALKKEIGNTHLRLGEETFPQELTIMRSYIEILGREIGLNQAVVSRILADEEIRSQTLAANAKLLTDLANELTLGLEGLSGGSIAFFGFIPGEDKALQQSAEQITRSRLAEYSEFDIIAQTVVYSVLKQLDLELPQLIDNSVALKVGSVLKADYLLVGRVVDMASSTVVFGKLLDRHTQVVRSVAQVLLQKDQ